MAVFKCYLMLLWLGVARDSIGARWSWILWGHPRRGQSCRPVRHNAGGEPARLLSWSISSLTACSGRAPAPYSLPHFPAADGRAPIAVPWIVYTVVIVGEVGDQLVPGLSFVPGPGAQFLDIFQCCVHPALPRDLTHPGCLLPALVCLLAEYSLAHVLRCSAR